MCIEEMPQNQNSVIRVFYEDAGVKNRWISDEKLP